MIIDFFKDTPHPDTVDLTSFHIESMRALREALEALKNNGVELEDPGDEIGPTSPGSPTWACGFTIRTGIAGVLGSERRHDWSVRDAT